MTQTRVTLIGVGGMARHHIRQMLKMQDSTAIPVLCEPSEKMYAEAATIFTEAGLEAPPNQPDLDKLLAEYGDRLDAAFIITPHAYHHDQTAACMEAGLDVLLEKPMVMNAEEAVSLIEVRDRTQKLLVVAFPGSLSPQISQGRASYTRLVNWANCRASAPPPGKVGGRTRLDRGGKCQKSRAAVSFLTPARTCSTPSLTWPANPSSKSRLGWTLTDRPVETEAAVIGKLASARWLRCMAPAKRSPSCSSDIYAFYSKAILRTGIWGERLDMQKAGESLFSGVDVPDSLGVWDQFLAVRAGEMENPCPPEVGLRMAKLYDAIKRSG